MTKKMEKKNKKVDLPPQSNPVRKFYELLCLMSLQDADYYEVDLDHQERDFKQKLTKKTTDFIKLQAEESLIKPPHKLLLNLVESKYIPDKLNISEYLHSRRIFDIAAEAWVRVRIEVLTLAHMTSEFIYTELMQLTGKELYSLEEIRSYQYFFWNFNYLDGWEDRFRKPFCDFVNADKLLSDFYSESIQLFSGKIELYDLIIKLKIKDEKGILRDAILRNSLRETESNALIAIKNKNAEENILWHRSWNSMKKIIEFKDAGNGGIIIPTYSTFNDGVDRSKNNGRRKKGMKVER